MRRYLACFIASIVATCMAIVIAVVLAMHVPFAWRGDEQVPRRENAMLTMEDLRQAEWAVKERMRMRTEEFNRASFGEKLAEIKSGGVLITWLPWLFVPFAVRLATPMHFLATLAPPIVFVLTPLVLYWELLTYSAALFTGASLAAILRRLGARL